MKSLLPPLILTLICLLHTSCKKQFTDSKNILIEKIIAESTQVNLNGKDQVLISNSQYCELIDCADYFMDYSASILVLGEEAIFMRGISNYTIIKDIASDNKSAKIEVRPSSINNKPGSKKTIDIKI